MPATAAGIGIARCGLLVGSDPDAEERYILTVSKCNLIERQLAWRYQVHEVIKARTVGGP